MNSIAELFYSRAWCLREDLVQVGSEIVDRHLRNEKLSLEDIQLKIAGKKTATASGDYEIRGNTAVIPVFGVIARRASMVNNISQPKGTSVESILNDFNHALNNADVKKIILNIDSPGGSADGIDELSDAIYNARGTKEIVAYTDGGMDSAAYWIGSSASKIYATKGADIGSIGVYTVLRDLSVYEHNAGIKTTLVRAGKYKAIGHPSKPVTKEDEGIVQERVDLIYNSFRDAVKRNRNMTDDQIDAVATGRTWMGSQAIENGLIDGIVSLDSIFNIDNLNQKIEGTQMSAESLQQTEEIQNMDLKDLKLSELKAGRADMVEELTKEIKSGLPKTDIEAVKAEGIAAGVAQERARISSIIDDVECKGFLKYNMQDEINSCIKAGKNKEETSRVLKDKLLSQFIAGAPVTPGPSADDSDQKSKIKTEISKALETQITEDWKSLNTQALFENDFNAFKDFNVKIQESWDKDANLREEFGNDIKFYRAYENGMRSGNVKIKTTLK